MEKFIADPMRPPDARAGSIPEIAVATTALRPDPHPALIRVRWQHHLVEESLYERGHLFSSSEPWHRPRNSLGLDPITYALVCVPLPRDVLELLDVEFFFDLLQRAVLDRGGGFPRALRRLAEERIQALDLSR